MMVTLVIGIVMVVLATCFGAFCNKCYDVCCGSCNAQWAIVTVLYTLIALVLLALGIAILSKVGNLPYLSVLPSTLLESRITQRI